LVVPEENAVMRSRLLAGIALLVAGSVMAMAQPRPADQEIGSWVLTCPAEAPRDPCQLHHRTGVLAQSPGGMSASLEVLYRGDQFIPVVAMRGLSTQAALGGVLTMQASVGLRFDGAPRIELACGLDGGAVVCAPGVDVAATAAAQLAAARSVVVQVKLGLPGGLALPEQARPLDLARTADALAAFRATAPASESVPVVAGLDWRGFLDRLARDAGFENGLADLLPGAGALVGGRRP
jgi:hypothetical protein